MELPKHVEPCERSFGFSFNLRDFSDQVRSSYLFSASHYETCALTLNNLLFCLRGESYVLMF